ncbi:hypothetical protein [Tsuneonella sp. HG222]
MGRLSRTQGDVLPTDPPLTLRHCPLDSGGYDQGGAYWGLGPRLYWCGNDAGDIDYFFRAADRKAAKATVREDYPEARFFS